eukprot:5759736-Prymnesium_polylepis.1
MTHLGVGTTSKTYTDTIPLGAPSLAQCRQTFAARSDSRRGTTYGARRAIRESARDGLGCASDVESASD